MPDPVRLHTLKNLTAALEGVTYQYEPEDPSAFKGSTDPVPMTGRVFRGRGIFGDESEAPFISILESPIPSDNDHDSRAGSGSKQNWELVVQGFVGDDRLNPTDPAHFLLAPVKRMLALEKRKADWDKPEEGILGLGQIVDDMYIGAGVVRPADELSRSAYFWLTLTLKMIEDLTELYVPE